MEERRKMKTKIEIHMRKKYRLEEIKGMKRKYEKYLLGKIYIV